MFCLICFMLHMLKPMHLGLGFVKNAAVWLTNYDAAVKRIRIERPYMIDKTPSQEIKWGNIEAHHGVSVKHVKPSSIKQLLFLVQEGKALEEVCKPVHIKVAPEPFSSEGGTRLPYHARMDTPLLRLVLQTVNDKGDLSEHLLVAKKSRYTSKAFDSCEAYKAQMEIQTVAAFLALHFNKISGNELACSTGSFPLCTPVLNYARKGQEKENFIGSHKNSPHHLRNQNKGYPKNGVWALPVLGVQFHTKHQIWCSELLDMENWWSKTVHAAAN
eukprot:1139538-Pelagomonas_calceolata.AAC.3